MCDFAVYAGKPLTSWVDEAVLLCVVFILHCTSGNVGLTLQ